MIKNHLVCAAAVLIMAAAPSRAAFEDLGAGARAPGMGNAFVSIADDIYTLYYNPAGLGLLERPQLGTSYTSLFPGLKDGSNLSTSFMAYAHPLAEGRKGTIATAWNSFSLSNLYREDSFILGYGRRWREVGTGGELYAGANLKYLRSSFGSFPEAANAVPTGSFAPGPDSDPLLSGRHTQTAIDGDVGLLYRLGKNYSLGLDVMHVNQPNVAFAPGEKDRLPAVVKLGADYRSLISNLAIEYDTQKAPTGAQDHTFTAAAERWFPKLFLGDIGLRGALSLGSRDLKQATAGFSYRTRRFSADYAMSLPIGGVATTISSHRVALTFRFGRATEEEESLEMVLAAMKQLKGGGRPSLMHEGGGRVFEEYIAQSRSLENHARYREALDKFTQALAIAPADKELADHYGRLNFVAQQIRQLPDYRSDPLQATLHLGVASYLRGDGTQAVEKVTQALVLAPQRKDIEGFLSSLETAVGIKRKIFTGKQPDHQVALKLTRAGAALEDGRYDEAVSLSLDVLRLEPDNAAAWENLGTAYFALQEFEDSRKAWNRAYELEKNPAVRAAIRGYLKSISKQHAKRPAVRKVAQPLPERPRLSQQEIQELFDQAVDHYTKQELPAAVSLLEKILAADPENVEAQKAVRRIREEMR